MKKYLLLIIGISFIMACKRNDTPGPINPGLFGKWELRRQYGGFAGIDSGYKAGNGRIIEFNSDSTYKQLNKTRIIEQGAFHIKKEEFSPGELVNAISFVDRSDWEVFSLNGTKLTIGNTRDDGIAEDYEKIGN